MQRRLCEMSEAKWSITEAKCLQMSHNKFASQRDAISPLYGNLMLLHSAGMQQPDISIAGMLKRFHFASLHYTFSAYLPTHIKFLTEFHRIVFGTTCISFQNFSTNFLLSTEKGGRGWAPFWIGIGYVSVITLVRIRTLGGHQDRLEVGRLDDRRVHLEEVRLGLGRRHGHPIGSFGWADCPLRMW